jgi:hypothetical protein
MRSIPDYDIGRNGNMPRRPESIPLRNRDIPGEE